MLLRHHRNISGLLDWAVILVIARILTLFSAIVVILASVVSVKVIIIVIAVSRRATLLHATLHMATLEWDLCVDQGLLD